MPVKKGKSKAIVSENIEELQSGKTHAKTESKEGKKAADKQSIAIALDKARESGAKIPKRSARPRRARKL